jgi:hypothetical protein
MNAHGIEFTHRRPHAEDSALEFAQFTAWLRTAPTTEKKTRNRAQALAERARRAIKNAPVCDSVQTERKATPALIGKALPATKTVADAPATAARPQPKTRAHRNGHLRDMARGMPCLLRVAGICTQDRATVVCCHSNLSIHGKAGARKADDQYSVWGCAACHRWLDTGPAPRAQKTAAFMAAHLAQVLEWRAIAFDSRSAPRDRAAAEWALGLLNSQPFQVAALAA